MATRFYIVPSVSIFGPAGEQRFPKYVSALTGNFGPLFYGFQPVFLVACDLTPAQDASVVANADVFAYPFNLDTNISGGAIASTRNAHEAFFIPAQDIPVTYRLMARYVAGLFTYMQRLQFVVAARTGSNQLVIDTGAKLNVQFGTLPVENQGDVINAAQSLGYDTSFIVGTSQIRAILKVFADGWRNESFFFQVGPGNLFVL
jgi:hypothetical protein